MWEDNFNSGNPVQIGQGYTYVYKRRVFKFILRLTWFLTFLFQISFDFTPSQLGIVESFWRFTIPEQNILVPFLLVGDAKEPAVATDRSHINFKSLLLGEKC